MESPLQVTFKNMATSEALEALIEDRVVHLERLYDKITRCHVVVEQPDRHQGQGRHFRVRIHLGVPGHELVVDHDPGRRERHVDAAPAVRDAFKALEKQLKTWLAKVRDDVKRHEEPPTGTVASLFPYEDHGFIQTPDGTEVYFNRSALVDADFDDLEVGARVTFVEQHTPKGPQASTVHVLS
jgi:cold shock CspA family protein/ribosome-associated translation inhibitor RaiA